MKSVQKITSKICQPNDCVVLKLLKESNKDKKIPIQILFYPQEEISKIDKGIGTFIRNFRVLHLVLLLLLIHTHMSLDSPSSSLCNISQQSQQSTAVSTSISIYLSIGITYVQIIQHKQRSNIDKEND